MRTARRRTGYVGLFVMRVVNFHWFLRKFDNFSGLIATDR